MNWEEYYKTNRYLTLAPITFSGTDLKFGDPWQFHPHLELELEMLRPHILTDKHNRFMLGLRIRNLRVKVKHPVIGNRDAPQALVEKAMNQKRNMCHEVIKVGVCKYLQKFVEELIGGEFEYDHGEFAGFDSGNYEISGELNGKYMRDFSYNFFYYLYLRKIT